MTLATSNIPRKLLLLAMIGQVRAREITGAYDEVAGLLDQLSPGFTLLSDLSRVDSIDLDCAAEIGRLMELCDARGVGTVIRIIPDSSRDIGMNILSLFHYRHRPRMLTFKTITEAAATLA